MWSRAANGRSWTSTAAVSLRWPSAPTGASWFRAARIRRCGYGGLSKEGGGVRKYRVPSTQYRVQQRDEGSESAGKISLGALKRAVVFTPELGFRKIE